MERKYYNFWQVECIFKKSKILLEKKVKICFVKKCGREITKHKRFECNYLQIGKLYNEIYGNNAEDSFKNESRYTFCHRNIAYYGIWLVDTIYQYIAVE